MSEIYLKVKCDENDRIGSELKKELKLPLNQKSAEAFKSMYKIKRTLRMLNLLKGDEISYGFEKEPEIFDKNSSKNRENEDMLLKFIADKNLEELDEYFKELSRMEDFKDITAYDVDKLLLQEYSKGKHIEGSISDKFENLKYHNICKRFRSGLQY